MSNLALAEYIWLDGGRGKHDPMSRVRSKTRVFPAGLPKSGRDLEWDFDGSSTEQSDGDNADLPIRPVRMVLDPFRGGRHVLILCEVMNQDSATPHPTNHRFALQKLMLNPSVKTAHPWVGFEQEYTLMKDHKPLGYQCSKKQGPYYCGVGAEEAFGREIAEEHLQLCLKAGLWMYGMNAEVCPGQWEYQIGPRHGEDYVDGTDMALDICDHMWLARYILKRVTEKHGIHCTLDVKPYVGLNGAGMHTNYSTEPMRQEGGLTAIEAVMPLLEEAHDDHIAVYGHKLHLRLTGQHETAPINKFSWGSSDRGASVRIPNKVAKQGYGYFEDRRPGANADPYQVAAKLIQTTLL